MKCSFLTFAALLSIALFSNQCKHTKYTTENLPSDFLRFGSGGGYTGAVTEYSLYDSGQVFKFDSKAAAPVEVFCTRKKTAGDLFASADSLQVLEREFDHPGNMYYFLEYRKAGKQHRVTWGDKDHPVDEKVKALYDQLTELVSKKK